VRQLQVVGVSDDGRRLLLAPSADGRATHSVDLDRRVERALRGQPIEDGGQVASDLSPKEIQARLRAGLSVEQVAREAGVPIGKVERYAGPVLSEREQVLDGARTATMTRPRGGSSKLPLGAAIDANLNAQVYARPDTGEWSAYRGPDGTWVVTYDVTVRGRRRRAEWAHHPAAREVTALNTYASQLGFVESARAAKPAANPAAKPATKPATKPAAKPAAKPATKRAAKAVTKTVAKAAAKAGARPGARVTAKPAAKAAPRATPKNVRRTS
jgi:Protein of unknown function (DUF3071)